MDQPQSSKISIQLFVGCLLSVDIKRQLYQSPQWKQKSLEDPDSRLVEVFHKNKDYLGKYVAKQMMTLSEFTQCQNELLEKIGSYCPNLDRETVKIIIFPQLFVG